MKQFPTSGAAAPMVRPMRPEDEPDVARVLAACDDYLLAATGFPALPADVQSLYYSLPDGADFEQKHLLVVCDGATVVGVVDAVAGHPDRLGCSVGLFLLDPKARRTGIGTRVARHLLGEAATRGMRYVTATCPQSWAPGRAFLVKMGFEVSAPAQDAGPTVGNRLRFPAEEGLCTAVRNLDGASADGASADDGHPDRGAP
ncbi:ribosomal protein S18 acetylase RimI-like enzyme [Streptomyces sp. 2132.2]|uniref:GNAT family N-acetyltransferase n=1 Tax=Streptomyces sp. 2132.2 TaxID=2485161 RepID=UPI000F9B7EC0|nr:GNAT family N-acetyltransferase [Streptomyces sp. 2132.2]ROQ94323.1 ribosomal protein S18 acetylase RimI-like enzyme [Streptomyces sp. 2132.2]